MRTGFQTNEKSFSGTILILQRDGLDGPLFTAMQGFYEPTGLGICEEEEE